MTTHKGGGIGRFAGMAGADVSDGNRTLRWTCYTAGAIFVILGALVALHPVWAAASIAVMLGVGFIISGLNFIVPYFTMRDHAFRPAWLLPMAVLDIFLGILTLTHIPFAVIAEGMLIAIRVLLGGGVRVWAALKLRSAEGSRWLAMLICGALMIVIGAVMAADPFGVVIAASLISGISLVAVGVLSIAIGLIAYAPVRG